MVGGADHWHGTCKIARDRVMTNQTDQADDYMWSPTDLRAPWSRFSLVMSWTANRVREESLERICYVIDGSGQRAAGPDAFDNPLFQLRRKVCPFLFRPSQVFAGHEE